MGVKLMAMKTKEVEEGFFKKAFNAITRENKIEEGGGLSSIIIPRQLNSGGVALVAGGAALLSLGKTGFKVHNTAKMGRVSYTDGPARMTNSFTSGAVSAMRQASGGDYVKFADMAEDIVNGPLGYGRLETYGATPELISALYGMGGR